MRCLEGSHYHGTVACRRWGPYALHADRPTPVNRGMKRCSLSNPRPANRTTLSFDSEYVGLLIGVVFAELETPGSQFAGISCIDVAGADAATRPEKTPRLMSSAEIRKRKGSAGFVSVGHFRVGICLTRRMGKEGLKPQN